MTPTKIILKPVMNRVVRPVVQRYLTKERVYRHKDIRVNVSPGVFHPGLFFSTKVMLRFLGTLDLSHKNLLEVGSGSGLISIAAAKQNAAVTAMDINPKAVRNTAENAVLNGVKVKTVQSDLFEKIKAGHFDIVVINPPFFLGEAADLEAHAWYCGQDGEFFQRFFSGVKKFTNHASQIYMVLSDEAPFQLINQKAAEAGLSSKEVFSKSNLWEKNFVLQFQL